MTRFVRYASLPPRRIVALAVLKHKAPASTVTFGRASKMIPITPMVRHAFQCEVR